jgi:hypothetical protein
MESLPLGGTAIPTTMSPIDGSSKQITGLPTSSLATEPTQSLIILRGATPASPKLPHWEATGAVSLSR